MNIYDVAKKAEVSIATVSRVINNSPKVSEKTRQRVLNVMNELNFTPNVFARGLGLNTMKTVGILCSDPSDLYVARALSYFEKMLRENGYDSLLCCSGYDTQNLKKYMDILISKSVDAVIMIGSKYISSKRNVDLIRAASGLLPVLLINGSVEGENIYCTYYDDFNAAKNAVNMLYNSGRKKVLFLYNSKSQSATRKLNGFLAGCTGLYIKKKDFSSLYCSGTDFKDVAAGLDKFTGKVFLPDAILASDDFLAAHILKYAQINSITVPDSMAVIGYDNSIFSKITYPELTTVDSRLFDLCKCTVKTLMEVFEGKSPPNISVLEPVIVERDTFKEKN